MNEKARLYYIAGAIICIFCAVIGWFNWPSILLLGVLGTLTCLYGYVLSWGDPRDW